MSVDSVWTEFRLIELLEKRYPKGQYALFSNVHNTTGTAHTRAADAIVLGLWPSRGLELHGFEIKVSRNDWLKERRTPEKAEEIAQYCDYWWLVISDPAYVKEGELPETWGMLSPKKGRLSVVKKAKSLDPIPLDRNFVAAILRRAHEQTEQKFRNYIPKNEIKNELTKAYEKGKKARTGENEFKYNYERLNRAVNKFELTSGVKIETYNGERLGKAVRYVLRSGSAHYAIKRTKATIENSHKVLSNMKKELDELENDSEAMDGWSS